jgi:hypothetical protein
MRLQTTTHQVLESFQMINYIGESKHAAKGSLRESLATAGKKLPIDEFMHKFGKENGIYSITTFKDYLSVSIQFANFAKSEFLIKDISLLNADHAKAFLQSKVKSGLAKDSIQKYSSALEKFKTALTIKYGNQFKFDIKNALPAAKKENLKVKERAGYHPYSDPAAIVNNITANKNIPESHKIAIKITAETGVRLHKAITVSGIRLNKDGSITTIVKGGLRYGEPKILNLSEPLRDEFVKYLATAEKSVFKLAKPEYDKILNELKAASKETGQAYQALHGFKHSHALDNTNDLQARGLSYK